MKVLAIVGPTASGKTAVGIDLALRLNGEIVSADSMQVYRGLDTGTAKPSPEEMRLVPHHMIDIRDIDQPFTVAEYQDEARAAIDSIHERGRLPIVTGGSGLYVRAAVDDLSFPPEHTRSAVIRLRLEESAKKHGAEALHKRLHDIDPASAEKIHPANMRRVIRALEVFETTGLPFSSFAGEWEKRASIYELVMVGITADRDVLYRLIDERVDVMVENGLVDEVKKLVGQGYRDALEQKMALGYREIISYLDGSTTLEEAVNAIKRNTRRFAKRQMTWFSRDPRVIWYKRRPGEDLKALALEIESGIIERL